MLSTLILGTTTNQRQRATSPGTAQPDLILAQSNHQWRGAATIVIALAAFLLPVSWGNAETMHASVETRNHCSGCDGFPIIINTDSGEFFAFASYTGPSFGNNGHVHAESIAFKDQAQHLNLGVFVDALTTGQVLRGGATTGVARWYDRWTWNPSSGLPRPAAVRFHYRVHGTSTLFENGNVSLLFSAQIPGGSSSAGWSNSSSTGIFSQGWDQVLDDNFVATFSVDIPLSADGSADWTMRLRVQAQTVRPINAPSPGQRATGDFFSTVTLTSVTLADGTPFEDGGSFESGVVPVPEPETFVLAGLAAIGLIFAPPYTTTRRAARQGHSIEPTHRLCERSCTVEEFRNRLTGLIEAGSGPVGPR